MIVFIKFVRIIERVATKDCVVEYTQRDVYTVHNDLEKVKEYVKIIRNLTT